MAKPTRIRNVNQNVQAASEQLRHTSTPTEQMLWQALRGGKLEGGKFRRQHAVGKFILDFYCAEHKIVPELDGAQHEQQAERDAERTAHLNAYGYRVLRFTNKAVYDDLPAVLQTIRAAIPQDATAPHEERD